jgi:peptide/nickel transport system substrate-binding protein
MKLRLCLLLAGISAFLAAGSVETARRPRYGGTLRVEIGAAVSALDPSVAAANSEEAAAKQQIDALIYERGKSADAWELTGPFRISEWQPGKFLSLIANNDYHDGRPFVDAIEIQMGRTAHDRLVDIELNKIDFAEIPPEQTRRAAERSIRVSASQPDELLALVFVAGSPATEDAHVREAIARSVDRVSLVNFILQKEGEPTGSLLPQWSSGTAFLFTTAADPARAKELSQQIPPSQKIVLGYDSGDSLEQNVAERIVVNAREAGISVAIQPIQQASDAANAAGGVERIDARLVRWSMPSPRPLESLMKLQTDLIVFGNADPGPLSGRSSSKEIYDREQVLLDGYRVVPLVWLPHVFALSSRVRDWQAPEPGQTWALADVWLEGDAQ